MKWSSSRLIRWWVGCEWSEIKNQWKKRNSRKLIGMVGGLRMVRKTKQKMNLVLMWIWFEINWKKCRIGLSPNWIWIECVLELFRIELWKVLEWIYSKLDMDWIWTTFLMVLIVFGWWLEFGLDSYWLDWIWIVVNACLTRIWMYMVWILNYIKLVFGLNLILIVFELSLDSTWIWFGMG